MKEKEAIREIANILNAMGKPCCRCLDCPTCKLAETIYNFMLMQPGVKPLEANK